MQAISACCRTSRRSKPAVSEMKRGAVLNGFMIGRSEPSVSTMASRKMGIGLLQQRKICWADRRPVPPGRFTIMQPAREQRGDPTGAVAQLSQNDRRTVRGIEHLLRVPTLPHDA